MMGNRIVRRRTAILLAASAVITSLAFAAYPENVHAETVNPKGSTMDKNEETLDRNEGTVKENDGTVTENDGEITNNSGTVAENSRTDELNAGSITTNKESGEVNNNFGFIGTNEGHVTNNCLNGSISDNKGTVDNNIGGITYNNGTVEENCYTINYNNGKVHLNDGGIVGAPRLSSDSGKVDINQNGIVKGNNTVGYDLGDRANSRFDGCTGARNTMYEIKPQSEGDWSNISVSGDNMLTFKDATIDNAATTQSLKRIDDDGSVMSVWLSATNNGVIYLSPTENTKSINDLSASAAKGSGNKIVVTRMDDGRWCLSEITGDVVLSYILELPSDADDKDANDKDDPNKDDPDKSDDIRLVPVVKEVAKWTLSEDNGITSSVIAKTEQAVTEKAVAEKAVTEQAVMAQVVMAPASAGPARAVIYVGGVESSVEMKPLSDPAVKAAMNDFLVKNLPAGVDVSKAKTIESQIVSIKEPGVLTIPVGNGGLTASSVVYVILRDLVTGQMKIVPARVVGSDRISFDVPYKECAFSVVTFD